MHDKIPVAAIVTTLNEEKNIARCLASLGRFDEVIVLDSQSTDKTLDVARSFGVTCISFAWNGQYPKKRQWALENLPLKHERVFFIDADEEATLKLCDEIAALDWAADGYFVRGRYVVNGKVLRFGLQNKKLCLFDRTKMEFPVVDDLDITGMGEIEGHYQPVQCAPRNIHGGEDVCYQLSACIDGVILAFLFLAACDNFYRIAAAEHIIILHESGRNPRRGFCVCIEEVIAEKSEAFIGAVGIECFDRRFARYRPHRLRLTTQSELLKIGESKWFRLQRVGLCLLSGGGRTWCRLFFDPRGRK